MPQRAPSCRSRSPSPIRREAERLIAHFCFAWITMPGSGLNPAQFTLCLLCAGVGVGWVGWMEVKTGLRYRDLCGFRGPPSFR